MNTIRDVIKRHPVLTYYVLTFAISWGSVLALVGAEGVLGGKNPPAARLPLLYVAMLLGPSLAGIALTGLLDGRAGLRGLWSRLGKRRVGARWYGMALLVAPLIITAVLVALSFVSSAFLPGVFTSGGKIALIATGLVAGLMVGVFEELGWTGFALHRLERRRGILANGLIMGILWGAWHFPLFSGSSRSSGEISSSVYLAVLLFSFLPAYRVIMVWVYSRTGSLPVAMLMHAGLTAGTLVLQPQAIGRHAVIYDVALAGVLWLFVAGIALAGGGRLSRRTASSGKGGIGRIELPGRPADAPFFEEPLAEGEAVDNPQTRGNRLETRSFPVLFI